MLRSHQKEGVNFIAHREEESTPASFSLWEPYWDGANQTMYVTQLLLEFFIVL